MIDIDEFSIFVWCLWLVASAQATIIFIAIQSARSSYHWMIRLSVFPAISAILLLVPAVELVLMSLIQFLLVWIYVTIKDYRLRVREEQQSQELDNSAQIPRRRFVTIGGLLYLTGVVASAIFLWKLTQTDMPFEWSVVGLGLTAGIAGALNVILESRLHMRTWFSACLCILFTIAVGAIYLAPSGVSWLCDQLGLGDPLVIQDLFFNLSDERAVIFFFLFGSLTAILLIVDSILSTNSANGQRRWWRLGYRVLVGTIPVYVVAKFIIPATIPAPIDAENALPRLLALHEAVGKTSFNSTIGNYQGEWHLVPPALRVQCVQELEPILREVDELDNLPYFVPLTYTSKDLDRFTDGFPRSVCRALDAVGQFQMDIEPDLACKRFLNITEISMKARRGGVLIDLLVGYACCEIGQQSLEKNRKYFSAKVGLAAAKEILELIDQAETLETIFAREKLWDESWCWQSRLSMVVNELAGDTSNETQLELIEYIHRCEIAQMRITSVGLACESFYKRNGRYPQSLAEVQEYLGVNTMDDPFSSESKPLVYRLTSNGYSVYSIGRNGVDDNGDTSLDGTSSNPFNATLDIGLSP